MISMDGTIERGVWPTMVTPFTDDNRLDRVALEAMVSWYLDQGVSGLFAVCQSSEMFFLSLEERLDLARLVVEFAGDRVGVVVSGHVSDQYDDQVREIRALSETGASAVVLVTNRCAAESESDSVWKRNVERLLKDIPSVTFGLYECPHPYKRLLSADTLQWCARTGRFTFLKETSCDITTIRDKLDAVSGSSMQIFNANSATLLQSLRLGVAGYSGVMANFHPDLYVWLCENWDGVGQSAEMIQSFLCTASLMELQKYPTNAKYHLRTMGLPVAINSRAASSGGLAPSQMLEVEYVERLAGAMRNLLRGAVI